MDKKILEGLNMPCIKEKDAIFQVLDQAGMELVEFKDISSF